ncbi:MAG: cob(I)yrinic acid a,c-diamide adenosyltransferase [Chloroflexi bacterium]|nr:cob(I)yrinic acid a,c-diamide adenosyltransferase [Chloroflexota bacterium]
MSQNKGRVHIFTGNGRGKTSAAIGTAVRACGYGYKVKVIFFMKGFHRGGEYASFDKLGIEWSICGRSSFIGPKDVRTEDIEAVEKCFREAETDMQAGKYDLLIFDELNTACGYEMFSTQRVLDLLNRRQNTEVILTGRYAPQILIDYADQVSLIENIKHAFDNSLKPKKGIDF